MWIYNEIGTESWFDDETGMYVEFEPYSYARPLKPNAYTPYDDDLSEEEIAELMYQDYLSDLQAEKMYSWHLAELFAELRMCCSE